MHYILGSKLEKNEKLTGKRNSRRVKPKLIFFSVSRPLDAYGSVCAIGGMGNEECLRLDAIAPPS